MVWWGPMLGVSEFPGERLCGFLQKIKTNGKVEEMAQTIMRRFCHQQRLLCKAPPENDQSVPVQHNIGGLFEMDDKIYEKLLKYHQAQDESWVDYRQLPYPEGANILSAYAHEVGALDGRDGVRFSKKGSSNIVKVEIKGHYLWAKVLHVLSLKVTKEMVVLVRWLDVTRDLVIDQMLERLSMVRVVQSFKEEFIPGSSVVSTLAHRELPAWTLGLNSPSLLLMGVNPGDHDYVGADELEEITLHRDQDAMELDADVSMVLNLFIYIFPVPRHAQ
ncbi:uncharacterized protein MELLADRAFT_91698 [Melampsora larici-populina 98AG31]|uniref:Uncharacterized protein n=1 Tax=Melampsora larici-populina (strain 98AG31 / pathotype 3-4-7) TaxID=747676 RepID=F4S003_MELLP|nr:uncharacterized protein MELLADRAFT_91698 [Melampsora larici-populina 98AG31]EGG02092.1 hypothetical protein MELLADRAFT_91698 [Melampsora larici-populina 98AG31]